MKEILHHDLDAGPSSAFEGPFGARTQLYVPSLLLSLTLFCVTCSDCLVTLCSANESMAELIQAKFTNFTNYDTDYPSMAGLVDKSALPLPKSTRSSTLVAEKSRNDSQKDAEPEKRFVMKKFQNVPGKLNLPKPGSKESKE